jgi:dimethylamine corrinoid protein
MAATKEELWERLASAVVDMDEENAVVAAQAIVDAGLDAYEAIEKGLAAGMEIAGRLFEEEEYFIPELLLCSDAMYAGLGILKPHLKPRDIAEGDVHRIVIGVIEGDTHDIGKNLVKILLETAGYEILDLGRDVSPQTFIDQAVATGAKIIAMSTLMTTTMEGLAKVIRLLQEQGRREQFKVLIGGAPVSQAFADRIGADRYAVNAAAAVRLAKQLTGGAV